MRALSFVGCAQGLFETAEEVDGTVPGALDASFWPTPVTPVSDGSATDAADRSEAAAATADAGCAKNILINEVQVQGAVAATDEFIELFNPGSCPIDVGGTKVVIRSKSGSTPIVVHQFPAKATLAPHAFFVVGGAAFSGPRDVTASAELDAVGGQIGLVEASGAIVDAVGYGASTIGAFVEKAPASVPPPGQSIGRASSALDTNDNAADFHVAAPTPRTSNN